MFLWVPDPACHLDAPRCSVLAFATRGTARLVGINHDSHCRVDSQGQSDLTTAAGTVAFPDRMMPDATRPDIPDENIAASIHIEFLLCL